MQTNTLTHTAKEKGDNCTGKKTWCWHFQYEKPECGAFVYFWHWRPSL